MTHLYTLSYSEPSSVRVKSASDPDSVTYAVSLNGRNSIADINGVPRFVFTRQTCI